VATDKKQKKELLSQAAEIVLHQSVGKTLLSEQVSSFLQFKLDPHVIVRIWIAAFIERAGKTRRYFVSNPKVCTEALETLSLLVRDSNAKVARRALQAASQYVQWTVDSFPPGEDPTKSILRQKIWSALGLLTDCAFQVVESRPLNTHVLAIRIQALKMLEAAVIALTSPSCTESMHSYARSMIARFIALAQPSSPDQNPPTALIAALATLFGTVSRKNPSVASVCLESLLQLCNWHCDLEGSSGKKPSSATLSIRHAVRTALQHALPITQLREQSHPSILPARRALNTLATLTAPKTVLKVKRRPDEQQQPVTSSTGTMKRLKTEPLLTAATQPSSGSASTALDPRLQQMQSSAAQQQQQQPDSMDTLAEPGDNLEFSAQLWQILQPLLGRLGDLRARAPIQVVGDPTRLADAVISALERLPVMQEFADDGAVVLASPLPSRLSASAAQSHSAVSSLAMHTRHLELSIEDQCTILAGTLQRILQGERAALSGGGASLRLGLIARLGYLLGEQGEEMISEFAAENAAERDLVLFQLLLKVTAEAIRLHDDGGAQANADEQTTDQVNTLDTGEDHSTSAGVNTQTDKDQGEFMDEGADEMNYFLPGFSGDTLAEVDAAFEAYTTDPALASLQCSERYDQLGARLVVALCGQPSKATAQASALPPRKYELPLTSVLLRMPYLSESVIQLLTQYCSNPGRILESLNALEAIAYYRPAIRGLALRFLFLCSTHESSPIRDISTRTVAARLLNTRFGEQLRSFAVHSIQSLVPPVIPAKPKAEPNTPGDQSTPTTEDDTATNSSSTATSESDDTAADTASPAELDRSDVKPLDEADGAVDDDEPKELSLSEDEILRRSALLLMLCQQDPTLFDEVIRIYIHCTRLGLSPSSSVTVQLNAQAVREVIHQALPELVPTFSIEFLAQRLIPQCPRGGEPLLLRLVHLAIDHIMAEYNHYQALLAENRALHQQYQYTLQQHKQQLSGFQKPAPPPPPAVDTLGEAKPPPTAIIESVRERAQRTADSRFLLPILPYLSKTEIVNALPNLILRMPKQIGKTFLNNILNMEQPVLPANELLIELHYLSGSSSQEWQRLVEAIQLCLDQSTSITQQMFATMLQQLAGVVPTPKLLFRLVLLVLQRYPALSNFVIDLLSSFINKKVWTDKTLWQGFIKCCEKTQPGSVGVLLRLPSTQLKAALTASELLRPALAAHYLAQNKSIPAALESLLNPQKAEESTAAVATDEVDTEQRADDE